jgi:RNA polymerase sigma-70 factor (ECF subfamily)
LLQQFRDPLAFSPEDTWCRFVKLYTPLLVLWAKRAGATEQEVPDLVQDVFLVLARELPSFEYDPARRFRSWLWTVLHNKWRDSFRRKDHQPLGADEGELDTLVHPDHAEGLAEEEYRAYLYARALELMRAELPAGQWETWRGYIVEGRPAADVARELGLSVNQVYLAKSRILRRLRAELEGLLD